MRVGTPSELWDLLAGCQLLGDPAARPYMGVQFSLEQVRIDQLVPLSKYVLREQVEEVRQLQASLVVADLDVFDLQCGVCWPSEGGRPLAVPVVEEWEGQGLLLVDGIHRVWAAREESREVVTCAVCRGCRVPLVPSPVSWSDVVPFAPGQFPERGAKRVYRFTTPDDVRRVVPGSAHLVTDDNFQYFLFRDLEAVGSSGIRILPSER